MYGRKRVIVAIIGLLVLVAYVLGIVPPIPMPAAIVGDGLGVAVPITLLVLAIIIAALSGAWARARQMSRDPGARTRSAVIGTTVIALIGVGLVALVIAAILSHSHGR